MGKKQILHQYDSNGICSYEYVEINGISQYVQIRGKSKAAPVLLVVHGGPGGALSGLAHVMQQSWEENFIVVNFDQRNSGKTYVANKSNAQKIGNTGSLEDYLSDIDGVISYLHTVLSFDRLYLMGFSWGSIIGAEYAKKYPQNLHAYIGVGQLVDYEKAFKYICDKAAEAASAKNKQEDAENFRSLKENYPKDNYMTRERMKQIRTFAILSTKYLVSAAKPFPVGAIISSSFMNFKEKKAMFLSDISLYQKPMKQCFHTVLQKI